MKRVIAQNWRSARSNAKWKKKYTHKLETQQFQKSIKNKGHKDMVIKCMEMVDHHQAWKKAYQMQKQLCRIFETQGQYQGQQLLRSYNTKHSEENEETSELRARHLVMPPKNKKLLKKMEKKANAPKASIPLQEKYMEELANHYPQEAVKRYESFKYPITPNITDHYVYALKKIAGVPDKPKKVPVQEESTLNKHEINNFDRFIDRKLDQKVHELFTFWSSKFIRKKDQPFRLPWWYHLLIFLISFGAFYLYWVKGFPGSKNSDDEEDNDIKEKNVDQGPMKLFGADGMKIRMVKNTKKSFDDVKGIDECKQELEEIVDFLKNPLKFKKMGARLPRGILLMGAPGCGKTLLAKAVATEAGVPFMSVAGSEFEQVFVGVGASRMRKLFNQAKAYNSPVLIFIDEIDSIARRRVTGIPTADNSQTLNEFLSQMDGFSKNDQIIIIGATNSQLEELDEALLRPGRFDRIVNVPLPDAKGRRDLIDYYLKKKVHDETMNVEAMARMTRGFSGAEIENCLNTAAIHAIRCKRNKMLMEDVDFAVDRQRMGVELKSRKIEEEDRELTAYHEAGHALVQYLLQKSNPESNLKVHKITIVPRGPAGGYTSFVPKTDVQSTPIYQLKEQIRVAMGGTVAEQIRFGADQVSGGASGDLRQATNIAFYMATRGLTDLGVVYYDAENASEMSKDTVDSMTDDILIKAKSEVIDMLKAHRSDLDVIAANLLKYETISGEEMIHLLNGQPIRESDDVMEF